MDWRAALDEYINTITGELRALRRHLHSHPEPSRQEYRTVQHLTGLLRESGVPHRVIASGRGIIAEPNPASPAARVALRADIDALNMTDLKDVVYRSTRDGVMHACGHDAHATMVLGAALALWHCRDQLPAPVAWRALFQPAEEVGEGAVEMIGEGAVEGVDALVALHVDPDLEQGRIAYRSGVLTAICQELQVSIRGLGGHAARPHQAVDPIGVAVQFINSVYQFIPRSIDSRDPVVVTFGSIQGGHSANVIPERVTLLGTVRTLTRSAAARVEERMRAIGRGLAEASEAEIDIAFVRGIGGVVNDPGVTLVCARAAAELVGPDHVDEIPLPSMGGEDFAAYLDHAPGCLLRLGVATPGQPRHFLHSPLFDIDERALPLGARLLARCAVLLATQGQNP